MSLERPTVGLDTPHHDTGSHVFWALTQADLVKLPKKNKVGEETLSTMYANYGSTCLIFQTGDLAYYSSDTDDWEIM